MKNSLIKISDGSVVSVSNINAQMELCKIYGYPPTFAERNVFLPNGTRPNGEPLYKIVKREKPVRIFDNGDHATAIAAVEKTYAGRVGLNRTRGKYNDEHRLLLGEAVSVEVKEVTPWAVI